MGLLKEIDFAVQGFLLTQALKKIYKGPEHNFITQFEKIAQRYKNNEAILFEDNVWTYQELEERANAYAHWARSLNIGSKKVIALLMENRSDYIASWLGILKTGNTAALINNNLTGSSLAYCMNISNAEHIILGAELADSFTEIESKLEHHPKIWVQGSPLQGRENLDAILDSMPKDKIETDETRKITHADDALYIYTSGTTGNPKAARISHRRLLGMGMAFAKITKAKPKDRNYIILPLYHSAGGVCAVGTSLMTGGRIVLKRKFSIKDFWDDIHKHRITQFQYIGELCRYLTSAPRHSYEHDHHIRVVIGNGLRPEVWAEFQPRFKIPKIIEFYGATEGNVSLFNFDGTIGAVGRIPGWARSKSNIEVVQFDVEKEEPIRDQHGFCIKCKPNETGEVIGKIAYNDIEQPGADFEGYVSKKETHRKILTNVFEANDEWFRTGDLLKYDEAGYFYFIDRIGDTFRWKGENVSTAEVSEVISTMDGVDEANVYGIRIPGIDGQAGMVSICTKQNLDLTKLHEHLCAHLPDYAQPMFLRLQKKIETTSTFKYRKIDLIQEGIDLNKIDEPLYFNDKMKKSFIPLDLALYNRLMKGEIHL